MSGQPPPPFALKARHVYDAFACGSVRGVTLEDFVKGFQQLSLELPPAAVADLHGKADGNGDGFLSLHEWQRMAEMYPTLIDCLYYRAVDGAAAAVRERELDDLHRSIEQMRLGQGDSHEMLLRAEKATQAAESALEEQDARIAECQQREDETRLTIEQARQATEEARASIRDALNNLNAAKDAERQAAASVQEVAHMVESSSRRLTIQASKVEQAEESVRELEQLLAEAKRNVDHELGQLEQLSGETQQASEREAEARELLQDASRGLGEASAEMQAIEGAIKERQAQEKECAAQLRDLTAATARERAARADLERAALLAQEAEKQQNAAIDQLAEQIERDEMRLAGLAGDHQDILTRREITSAEEQPLMEQELSLRKQREVLEHKEQRLNNEVTAFVDRAQRSSSPVRGGRGHPASMSPRNMSASNSPLSTRTRPTEAFSPPRPKLR